ncbi:MAG: hypothetical protein ABJH04_08045 [Cyclobacteriaceae bacterium]
MATFLKHKHYKMEAEVLSVCNNGSLKVMLTDHTAPSAKLRKPKKYTISLFEKAQWETVAPAS